MTIVKFVKFTQKVNQKCIPINFNIFTVYKDLYFNITGNKNDVDGATKVFEEARSRGIELDKIYVYALEKYQTLLESSGKSVPWEVRILIFTCIL